MTIYFTSDLHLGHNYVLGLRNTTDEDIITTINDIVQPDDTLYILGDFTLTSSKKRIRAYRDQIACQSIHLVKGNHDHNTPTDAFTSVTDVAKIGKKKRDGYAFIACHYPFQDWDMRRVHLHGHIHSTPAVSDWSNLPAYPSRSHGIEGYNLAQMLNGVPRLDVGWDAWHKPVSAEALQGVIDFFAEKQPMEEW